MTIDDKYVLTILEGLHEQIVMLKKEIEYWKMVATAADPTLIINPPDDPGK